MSDTPRTDAFIKSDDVRLDASCMRSAVDWSTIPMKRESLLIDFARQLEHELTAAKVEIERLTREQDDVMYLNGVDFDVVTSPPVTVVAGIMFMDYDRGGKK